MATTRIYVVSDDRLTQHEHQWQLVEASSAAQAIRHVTRPYQARVAAQADLVRLLQAGVKVEKASAE